MCVLLGGPISGLQPCWQHAAPFLNIPLPTMPDLSSLDGVDAAAVKRCSSCKRELPIDAFSDRKRSTASGKRGTRADTCCACLARITSRRKRKAAEAASGVYALEDFLDILNNQEEIVNIKAKICVTGSFTVLGSSSKDELRERAKAISEEIGHHMSLHWK